MCMLIHVHFVVFCLPVCALFSHAVVRRTILGHHHVMLMRTSLVKDACAHMYNR